MTCSALMHSEGKHWGWGWGKKGRIQKACKTKLFNINVFDEDTE